MKRMAPPAILTGLGAEQRLDPLINAALLNYSPLASEFKNIQFESDWSFFKSLMPKRKPASSSISSDHSYSSSITSQDAKLPTSPGLSASTSVKAFNSIRQTITRSSHTSLSSVFTPSPTPTSTTIVPETTPLSLTNILTSVHSLLALYSINPAIIIQIQTQVMYWLACEVFNRIVTRKSFMADIKAHREEMDPLFFALILSTVASTLVQVPRSYLPFFDRPTVRKLALYCAEASRLITVAGYDNPCSTQVVIRYL